MSFAGSPPPQAPGSDPSASQANPLSQPGVNNAPSVDIHGAMAQDLNTATARFNKVSQSMQMLEAVRKEFDKLTAMGDTVSMDDVIKGAGVLVSRGLSAPAIAGILADAPDNPQALQAWVSRLDNAVIQQTAQREMELKLTRHAMAVAGLKSLVVNALRPPGPGVQPPTNTLAPAEPEGQPGEATNPLTPGG